MTAGQPSAVRVMVGDDHSAICDTMCNLVAATPGFELVADARSGLQALDVARTANPMLVLMDVQMPGVRGIEAARRLTRAAPATVVVLVSADPDSAIDALASGACALLDKKDLRAGVLAQLWSANRPETPSRHH